MFFIAFNLQPKYKINSHSLYNSVRIPKPNDMNEIVPIRKSSQDKKKLQESRCCFKLNKTK